MFEHIQKINDKVSSALADIQLLDSVVLLGVSGGPDSSVLLHVLANLRNIYNFDIEVMYIDHGLRENSEIDAKYVEKFASVLGIENFYTCNVSNKITRLLKNYSPEEAARRARYDSLIAKAREIGAKYIATGHNQDDQIETILLHIIRGSALQGLVGMSYVGELKAFKEDKIKLIRPLLEINRLDIELYCKLIEINPLIDYTNNDLTTPRNFIRHKISPSLREMNPKIGDAINRLSRSVKHDLNFINKAVFEAWDESVLLDKGKVVIDRLKFLDLDVSIQRYIIMQSFESLSYSGMLSELLIDLILDIALGPSGRSIDLPDGLIARNNHRSIIIGSKNEDQEIVSNNNDECVDIKIPGVSFFNNFMINCSIVNYPNEFSVDPNVEFFDISLANEKLLIRFNNKGDFFNPLGMKGNKKLKDYFIDNYLEKHERKNIPVIESSQGIIWVVKHRISEWAKVRMNASMVLRVEFSELN